MPQIPQVKIFVDNEEHALIRLAAAVHRVSMTRFARDVVLAEARRVTEEIVVPENAKMRSRGRKG